MEADIAVAEEAGNKKHHINPKKNAGSKSFGPAFFWGNRPTGQYHYVLHIVDLRHFTSPVKIVFSPLLQEKGRENFIYSYSFEYDYNEEKWIMGGGIYGIEE